MSDREVLVIYLIVGLIKRCCCVRMIYYAEPHTNINITDVELAFANYATRFHLQKATGFDTLKFYKKDDIANFKIRCSKTRSWGIKKSFKHFETCFKHFEKQSR